MYQAQRLHIGKKIKTVHFSTTCIRLEFEDGTNLSIKNADQDKVGERYFSAHGPFEQLEGQYFNSVKEQPVKGVFSRWERRWFFFLREVTELKPIENTSHEQINVIVEGNLSKAHFFAHYDHLEGITLDLSSDVPKEKESSCVNPISEAVRNWNSKPRPV